ncbi:hypothetical protein KZ483_02780 [Paenibacillus sp. sptzw28]|uniref:hypothetical protein n=1 Tax=Paenibacillus sp. sptzw28 TaxID=715179 RepID=UPI001C6E75BE|nr:hypothetical protein [Paenibacillus sp. sptzw28]QYR21977.1 hypothetical protein KZ483_02780 [Paenibacillus sp. sptzw28]
MKKLIYLLLYGIVTAVVLVGCSSSVSAKHSKGNINQSAPNDSYKNASPSNTSTNQASANPNGSDADSAPASNQQDGKAALTKPQTEQKYMIRLDAKSYSVSYTDEAEKKFIFATMTDRGVVWTPAPELADKNSIVNIHPITPITFYLSPKSEKDLTVQKSVKLFSLPLTVTKKSIPEPLYSFVEGVHASGAWLVYTTAYKPTEVPQSPWFELHVYNLQTKKDRRVATLHYAGGYHYGYNIYKTKIFYWQESPGPDPNPLIDKYYVYDILTNKTKEIRHNSNDNTDVIRYDGNKISLDMM